MRTNHSHAWHISAGLLAISLTLDAGTFTNRPRLEITDPTGALSWNTNAPGLTVSCWLKISVPSGVTVTENMTALVNRRSGTDSDPHAYLIHYNISSGFVEFSCRGLGGSLTRTLIETPYLDRWYHVAVVRQQDGVVGYVDGRQVFSASASLGNSASTDGVSIGGCNNSKYFYGEIQEVAIYQNALSQEFIVENMFKDQPALTNVLKGYFKLGYSTNAADNLKNFAPPPLATNTDLAVKQGSGTVEFEEANQAGEQSYFDAQKNGAQNFLVPLSGAFSLNQPVLSRPTPGITFDFRLSYSSANTAGGAKLGGTDPYASGPIGKGWRHIFETRIIPAQTFSPLADVDTLGLATWDGSIETWDADVTNGVPTGTYHRLVRKFRHAASRGPRWPRPAFRPRRLAPGG